jgi:hypothetical protein
VNGSQQSGPYNSGTFTIESTSHVYEDQLLVAKAILLLQAGATLQQSTIRHVSASTG